MPIRIWRRTRISPRAAAAAGRDYPALLDSIVKLGLTYPAQWRVLYGSLEELLLVAGLLLLAACAAASPRREDSLLAELAAMLPGSYDNLAQSRASAGHPALRLVIAPVQAALVGEHVFYVQEMAADDPRRVLSQRLYVLNSVPEAASRPC